MTTIAMGNDMQLGANTMGLMYEFRYDVFVRRLGWSLPATHQREADEYDTADAKYVVVRDVAGRVTACARLIPTTSSYMLPKLFPQLLGQGETPRDPAIWELSRFATSVRETHEGRVLSLSVPTLRLLDLVLTFARAHGVVRLLLVTSIAIERLMLRARVPAHRIGPPAAVEGELAVALYIEVSPEEGALTTLLPHQRREAAQCVA